MMVRHRHFFLQLCFVFKHFFFFFCERRHFDNAVREMSEVRQERRNAQLLWLRNPRTYVLETGYPLQCCLRGFTPSSKVGEVAAIARRCRQCVVPESTVRPAWIYALWTQQYAIFLYLSILLHYFTNNNTVTVTMQLNVHHTTRKHQHAEEENKNSRGKRNKNTKRSGT
jgi:hypothetical protein